MLWQDDVKTLFDPCPADWRVPKSGVGVLSPWNAFGTNAYAAPFFFYIDGVRQTAAGTPAFVVHPNNGRLYENGNTKAWYPSPGFRGLANGSLDGGGDRGYYWSSTNAGYMEFYSTSLNPSSAYYRAFGFTVRCVRE